MKKMLSAIICYVLIIMLTSCTHIDYPDDPDLHEGYRWRAIEANIYFDVSVKYYDISSTNQGSVTENDNTYTFTVSIAPGGYMDLYKSKPANTESSYSESEIFSVGKIKSYKEEKFTLAIFEEFQNFFGEHIETLTFIREPTPDYVEIEPQSGTK